MVVDLKVVVVIIVVVVVLVIVILVLGVVEVFVVVIVVWIFVVVDKVTQFFSSNFFCKGLTKATSHCRYGCSLCSGNCC